MIKEIVNDGVPTVPPTKGEDIPIPSQMKDLIKEIINGGVPTVPPTKGEDIPIPSQIKDLKIVKLLPRKYPGEC